MRYLSFLVAASCLFVGLVAMAGQNDAKVKSPSEEIVHC